MKPRHYRGRADDSVTAVAHADDAKKEKEVADFYEALKEKAQGIPCEEVDDCLTKRVAKLLLLNGDSFWEEIVVDMKRDNILLTIKQCNKYEKFEEPAFFLFLKHIYGPEEKGTLWGLIDALHRKRCIIVLEDIKWEVKDFVKKFQVGNSAKCGSLMSSEPHSSDSGFNSVSSSNPSLDPSNPLLQECRQTTTDIVTKPSTSGIPVSTENVGTRECAIADSKPNSQPWQIDNEKLSLHNGKDNKTTSPPSYTSSLDQHIANDLSTQNRKKFNHAGNAGNRVKVFIAHTRNEEDIAAARITQQCFRDDFDFDTTILEDVAWQFDAHAPSFLHDLLKKVDFVVPILSQQYLWEIRQTEDPGNMLYERLTLRYLHSCYQDRVLNKFAMNILVRPLTMSNVTFGEARMTHEFQTAVRFPEHLGRLGTNLRNTKILLMQRNGFMGS